MVLDDPIKKGFTLGRNLPENYFQKYRCQKIIKKKFDVTIYDAFGFRTTLARRTTENKAKTTNIITEIKRIDFSKLFS